MLCTSAQVSAVLWVLVVLPLYAAPVLLTLNIAVAFIALVGVAIIIYLVFAKALCLNMVVLYTTLARGLSF